MKDASFSALVGAGVCDPTCRTHDSHVAHTWLKLVTTALVAATLALAEPMMLLLLLRGVTVSPTLENRAGKSGATATSAKLSVTAHPLA